MFSSSSSSSSSKAGLMRHSSAPSSLLTDADDSVNRQFFSAFAPQIIEDPAISNYGIIPSSPLIRHSSSPPGFLNDCLSAADISGFSITRGMNSSYNNSSKIIGGDSKLSFPQQISAENESDADNKRILSHSNITASSSSFITMGLLKHDTMESQFQFGLPQAELELSTMDKFLNIPQDSVPCKIRAKRGFATHPRSIAERDRRTRISGKLKKLQDLVPNMDKQTSYADMLDLAVQHIKSLQNQVQKLNNETDSCTCGCKKTATS